MFQSLDSTLAPLVRKLSYWRPFDDADEQALLALPHQVREYEPSHFIVREREKPSHCCLMLSGFAFRHKVVRTGERQIMSLHMKGDMVDLHNSVLGTADHSVQTLVSSRVAMIPRAAVVQLAFDRPAIGYAMWFDTLVDGAIFREWIVNVGRRDAKARLAHLLCEFALRLKVAGLGEKTNYELPMTQEQLADALGLTPVHVNRTIRSLEAEGLISRSRSRSIEIGDWRKLAAAGDFDSTYLHLHEDEPALA
jgi:CRP-like cAMP-binding protein